jgi:hypothetical protein
MKKSIVNYAQITAEILMREGTVRQWCRMFKSGRTNVHDEERSGRQYVVSSKCLPNICEKRRFTFSEIFCVFPQISHIVLYEIIEVRLVYHKFCTRWVPEILAGAHKPQRMASALTSSEQYHKYGDKFPNHIVRVTQVMKPGFHSKRYKETYAITLLSVCPTVSVRLSVYPI